MKTLDKKILIYICIAALSAFFCQKADGQVCAVKTDAAMWAGITPNIGFELVTGERTSVEATAFGHLNPYGITSKMLALQPQFRYWFNGRPMVREYVGVAALLIAYDTTLPQQLFGKGAKNSPMQVYDGDAAGLGITGGYVLPLGRRFNMELSCGLGVVCFRQKQYFPESNPDKSLTANTKGPNSWGYKLIPVDLGITFSYILK